MILFIYFIILSHVYDSLEVPPEVWMTIPDLVQREGYQSEKHNVITSDSYILEHHRIPSNKYGKKSNSKMPPVVLLHGLLSSSRDFLLLKDKSLAIMLAEAGYDVWLINLRFTEMTTHVNLSRSDYSYWDFGYEEYSSIDLPESIDYVLNITKHQKVIFIGYSIGNAINLFMCTNNPNINDKIALNIYLGPMMIGSSIKTLSQFFINNRAIETLMGFGINHFESNNASREFLTELCNADNRDDDLCYHWSFFTFGDDWEAVEWQNYPLIYGKHLSCSLKEFHHLVQFTSTGVLRKYDYGPKQNARIYGTVAPTLYNMKACTSPTVIYYGNNDKFVPIEDVNKIVKEMSAPTRKLYLRSPKHIKFNHLDFISGNKVSEELYEDIMKFMKKMGY